MRERAIIIGGQGQKIQGLILAQLAAAGVTSTERGGSGTLEADQISPCECQRVEAVPSTSAATR
jgi:hypothetical protein